MGMHEGHFPEWLLTELLVRLPVKFVFRSKLVSKQWLSLISDPCFKRMYVSRVSKQSRRPWTFISNYFHAEDSRSWGFHEQDFLPDVNVFKLPNVSLLPSPSTEDQPQGTIHNVIGVNNGIVLYGSLLPDGLYDDYNQYSICNPITKQWIRIPPHGRYYIPVSTGFVAQVEENVLTSFRVVCIEVLSCTSKDVIFELFISEIGAWKKFNVCTDQVVEVMDARTTPTALDGILYWMACKHVIIAYDPHNNPDHLRFIALPGYIDDVSSDDEMHDCVPSLLDVHQGRLRYFESSIVVGNPPSCSGFDVWILNDYSTGKDWCLQHRIKYSDILYHDIPFGIHRYALPISFHPLDSNIVYLGHGDKFASCNMKTKRIDDIWNVTGEKRRRLANTATPIWWSTFLFMIPPWPIYTRALF